MEYIKNANLCPKSYIEKPLNITLGEIETLTITGFPRCTAYGMSQSIGNGKYVWYTEVIYIDDNGDKIVPTYRYPCDHEYPLCLNSRKKEKVVKVKSTSKKIVTKWNILYPFNISNLYKRVLRTRDYLVGDKGLISYRTLRILGILMGTVVYTSSIDSMISSLDIINDENTRK